MRIALLALAIAAFALVAAVAALSYVGGLWGCPSQAELQRPRPPEKVAAAFADAGFTLVRTPLPRAGARADRAARGAATYRYATARARLYVLVCGVRRFDPPRRLRRPVSVGTPRQQVRQFSTLGNNIAIFMTDNDRGSGRQLQARVQPVLNDLDSSHQPGDRCYTGH